MFLSGILKHWVVAIVVVAISSLALSVVGIRYYLSSPAPLAQMTTVIIPRGSSQTSVLYQLADQQVIRYPLMMRALLKWMEPNTVFKAGEYQFNPGITPKDVLKKLAAGDVIIRKITVVEGITATEVQALLEAEPALEGDITESLPEGFLLPDTYHFQFGDSRDSVIHHMKERSNQLLLELWEKRNPDLPFSTPAEALTLASVVEKETGKAEERPLVAGVFVNRLRKGMRLQSDPTVIYAITEGKEKLDRPLLRKDLDIDSPYNTYKVVGLPPAPIANPGEEAIRAVFYPEKTDAIFFVAKGDGSHYFAATLKEHNENVKRYKAELKRQQLEQKAKQEEEAKKNATTPSISNDAAPTPLVTNP